MIFWRKNVDVLCRLSFTVKKKIDTSTISMSVQAMMMSAFNHYVSVYIMSCKN